MQTIQASRTYMMCARDKVVDLGEYRRSLADCWSVPTQAPAEPRVLPVPVPISRPRRRSSRLRRCALAMDVLASPGGGGHDRRLYFLGVGHLTVFSKIPPRSQKVFNSFSNFS